MYMERARLLLLIPAIAALLLAIWAGLVRMGWQIRPIQPAAHGPLMVCGFLGTVICLERAVALAALLKGARWLYSVPLLCAVGAIVLMISATGTRIGPLLLTLSGVGLVMMSLYIIWQQTALYTITMGLGALAWLVGNGLWLTGSPVYLVTSWWVGFLVLTIAGERLELSRILRHPTYSLRLFSGSVVMMLVGISLTIFNLDWGVRLAGLSQIALALWLLRYDIARRTIRQTGLTRFIAACLLPGYVWLGIGGGLAIITGGVLAGIYYDAMLHAVLLGFVFSMIFAHMPIILPAVTGLQVRYSKQFYAHLLLLHVSLLIRLSGDLTANISVRQWGGLLNAFALLLFIANTIYSVWRGIKQSTAQPTPAPDTSVE